MSLRIHTLGPFRIYRDVTPILDSDWKTQKNRTLLKILITYRKRALTKDQLIEWLWRDLSPDAAGRNLRVAVSQLRRVLEPNLPPRAKSSFVLTTDAGYAWNTKADYWLDAEEFEGLADSRWQIADGRWQVADSSANQDAISHQPSAISDMQSALSLYRGDYLEEDRYADWATAERERLRELYFTLLTRLAEVYARRGRYRRAVAACREVLATDRCRESVWCQLMLYYYHAGDQALARRAYEECRQALAEELGVEPMPTTAALAEQIRRRAVAGEQTYPLPATIERVRQLPVSLGRIPFVGRDQEFARLAEHWKAAQSGRGHAVIIQGEAGLGKTRLAQEMLGVARQQGTWVLQGKAREMEGVLPYQPLIDALRSAGDIQRDALENLDVVWRVELSRLLPEWSSSGAASPPAGQTPGRVFEALTRYLIALAQSQAGPKGLILFVDDLHWADQTTVEFLGYLGSRLATQPIMLLGAMRPEEVEPRAPLRQCLHELRRAGRLHSIDLQHLTREAVTRLVQEASQDSPAAQQISRRLYWESQGHPLFMVALLQAFFEDGVFYVDKQGRWGCDEDYLVKNGSDLAIPRLVTDVIHRRVQRMDVRAQRLLALCAVVGRPFEFALLHRASGQEEEALLDALEQALEHRLLQATDEPMIRKYDLSHDLVRRTLYQTLSPDRRALLHRKVLAALESTQPASGEELVGELAHHAIQGQVWAGALDYCKRAAEVAVGRYALHEALKQCERGLAALDALERDNDSLDPRRLLTWRYDLLAIRQLAAHLLGQREPAVLDELVSLARQVGDRERLAQAYFALMRYYIDTGQNQAALELVPMYAPIIAQGVAPATAIGFHQRVGFLYYRTGHLDRALEHHNEALRLARAADDVHQQAVVFNTRGTVLMCLGRYQEAISDFTHAADLWSAPTQRLFRAFAVDNRGDVLYYLGCYEDNLRAKEGALPLYREFAYPIVEAECLSDTGACLRAMGRTAEAEAHLQEALALSQSLHDSYDLVQSLNGLALLHLEQGDQAGWRLAENYASRAVTEAQQADLPHGTIQGLAYQAIAHLRQGRYQESLERSSQAVTQLKVRGYIEGAEEEIHFIHSQVLAANGQRTAAREALQQAHDEMMAKAGRLTDPELRGSFLERVWVNRAIQAAMAGYGD